MNAAALIAALELPADSRVDRRVPKKLLAENGAPTPADRRRINEGIEELFWVAALKPTTIGVPPYHDDVREYLEIAVLRMALRAGAKASRLLELVHRAIPYPVLLIADHAGRTGLSATHLRWSQGEAGKMVLDGDVVVTMVDGADNPLFLAALALARQPRDSLHALYQGWVDTLLAVQAERLTGIFTPAAGAEHAAARRDALRECARLETEMAALRAAAAREPQLSRQVELNLELQRLRNEYAAACARL